MSIQVKQAKAKAVSENPFYGLKGMLNLNKFFEKSVDADTNQTQVNNVMANAWAEAKTLDQRQLFFMIIFAGGDITNREHNMFANIKVDQGGQSKRKTFRLALNWILTNKKDQFYKFLPLISEYTNYENLFYNQIRTDRYKGGLISKERLPIDHTVVAQYLRDVVLSPKTTDFERACIAKFLPKVPQAKRWRKDKEGKSVVRNKKPHTLEKDKANVQLIDAFTTAMGFDIQLHEKNIRYIGYEKWRTKYLAHSEAHLFSTKKIEKLDKVQFLTWLEGLPSSARHRVQCRLFAFDKTKGSIQPTGKWKLSTGEDMSAVYTQWTKDKEQAMIKLKSLTEEAKATMDKKELRTLEKQAKVTTGASTIYDAFIEIYKATGGYAARATNSEQNVKLQTLVDKVKLDVPVMVCVDTSGSMGSRLSVGGASIDRIDAAKLFTSIMLYKNPNDELASTFMTFSDNSYIFSDGLKANAIGSRNRFMTQTASSVQLPKIADKQKPFIETLRNVDKLFQASGYTDFSTVCDTLKRWVEEDPQDKARRIEIIQGYPVWVMISDGDLNSAGTPGGSMDQFKSKMKQWFGAEPVIVVWDIIMGDHSNTSHFENIDNVVHLAGVNPGIINQLFYNIDDLDVIDIYTQLNTLFSSSRYQPVKQKVS